MKDQQPRFWTDALGRQQPERRSGIDRRDIQGFISQEVRERRKLYRRRLDREVIEHDHKEMIEEALSDFAAEHGGHL